MTARLVRDLPVALLSLFLGIVAGCGGGNDALPAAAPDEGAPPASSGSVTVASVSTATLDGTLWLTRSAEVTVRGKGPTDATIETLAAESGRLVAATTAGPDGAYALGLPLADGSNVFTLRARARGASPGPATQLRVFRRTLPPSPFQVDPLPGTTGGAAVVVQGTTEADIVVIVRVTGGAAPVETRKPAGTSAFSVSVPLVRDRENRLEITGNELAGNRTDPVVRVVLQDSAAPASPEITVPGGPVAALSISLSGRAPGAVRVETTAAPGGPASSVAPDGTFSLELPLAREGENLFDLVALDGVGNRSAASRVRIVRDTVPPGAPSSLSVSNHPVVDGGTVPLNDRNLLIEGTAEPGAVVTASGVLPSASGIAASGDGAFGIALLLPQTDAAYRIELVAVDAAGNSSGTAAFTVVLDTSAPPPPEVVDPGAQAGPAVTIRGRASAADHVDVSGPGAQTARAPVEEDGGFEVDVPLNDGENSFGFVAVDSAGNRSERAELVIVRVPPPAGEEPPSAQPAPPTPDGRSSGSLP